MGNLITVIHVVTCVFLVLMVMIQSGKGAEISASFGGSSQTVFGSSGGANFFVKLTGALAAIFFTTSLVLTVLGGQSRKSLFETSAMPRSTGDITQPAKPAQGTAPQGQPAANPGAATAPQGQTAPTGSTAAAPQGQTVPAKPADAAKH